MAFTENEQLALGQALLTLINMLKDEVTALTRRVDYLEDIAFERNHDDD